MPEPLRRIVVLTHKASEDVREALAQLAAHRERLGLQLMAPAEEAAKHPQLAGLGYRLVDDLTAAQADVCLVFGGDGTVLRALGRLLDSGVPTLGVNYGHVGFLTALPRHDWWHGLEDILRGRHRVIDLLTVDVQVNGDRFTAVNDVILSRVALRHVLHIEYRVSNVTVGRMLCDGLIVASPAGSTAYNLSCGGPIVEWDANVMVLNFIAPHSLGFRPVILRPDHQISASNVSPVEEADVVVDGISVGRLCCGDEVRIAAGRRHARLMARDEGSFYQSVEEKLFDRRDAR